jgi:signal transduction histidine kinase
VASPARDAAVPANYPLVRRAVGETHAVQTTSVPAPLAASPARIAHDLTNLLLVVSTQVHAARAKLPADHPISTELEIIQQMAQRMGGLASALSEGDVPPAADEFDRVPTNLCEWLADALPLVRRLLPPTIEVEADTHELLPLWCWANSLALDRVLFNLASNAREAMPKGGKLFLGLHKCEETAGRAQAVLVVRDSGRGMTATVAARAFEPFYTTSGESRGRGLGLAIVKEIVKAHGGSVALQSKPGKGTEVRVALPAVSFALGD